MKTFQLFPEFGRKFHSATVCLINLNSPLIHKVNWGRVTAGFYAVADPADPGGILYMGEKEYKLQLRVSLSSDTPLIVIARPGEAEPDVRDYPASNQPPKTKTPPSLTNSVIPPGFKTYSSRYRKKFWWAIKEGGMVVPTEGNLNRLFCHWGNTLWVWNGFPAVSAGLRGGFSQARKHLDSILVDQGAFGLIMYLKVSFVAIQKVVAGTPLGTTWALGHLVRLDRSGLPRWLPVEARQAIRRGHAPTIRTWISALYVYKALNSGHSEKRLVKMLTGIARRPLTEDDTVTRFLTGFRGYLREEFVPKIVGGPIAIPVYTLGDLEESSQSSTNVRDDVSPRLHAGPNRSPGLLGAPVDAVLLRAEPALFNCVSKILVLHQDTGPCGLPQLLSLSTDPAARGAVREMIRDYAKPGKYGRASPPILSKLHALYEAAGKVRLIAILDYWSQRALEPFHKSLMELLRRMPEDGTYDQGRLFHSLQDVLKDFPKACCSSLDMSSATDNIPLVLYRILLEELFTASREGIDMNNRDAAISYANLILGILVDRDFLLPVDYGNNRCDMDPLLATKLSPAWGAEFQLPRSGRRRSTSMTVRYGRGQPMGALGSFGLLGLIHHSLIGYSAWLSDAYPVKDNRRPYDVSIYTYGVVGDDMALLERAKPLSFSPSPVADEYLNILRTVGVPVSLTKSFSAVTGFFTLVSRYSSGSVELSPISFKQELQVSSYSARSNMIYQMVDRGWTVDRRPSLAELFRMVGSHYDFILNKVEIHHGKVSPVLHRALFTILIKPITDVVAHTTSPDLDPIKDVLRIFWGLVSEVTLKRVNMIYDGRSTSSQLSLQVRAFVLVEIGKKLVYIFNEHVNNGINSTLAYMNWYNSLLPGDYAERAMFNDMWPPFFMVSWQNFVSLQYSQLDHPNLTMLGHSLSSMIPALDEPVSENRVLELERTIVQGIKDYLLYSPAPNYRRKEWVEFTALEARLETRPGKIDEIFDLFITAFESASTKFNPVLIAAVKDNKQNLDCPWQGEEDNVSIPAIGVTPSYTDHWSQASYPETPEWEGGMKPLTAKQSSFISQIPLWPI